MWRSSAGMVCGGLRGSSFRGRPPQASTLGDQTPSADRHNGNACRWSDPAGTPLSTDDHPVAVGTVTRSGPGLLRQVRGHWSRRSPADGRVGYGPRAEALHVLGRVLRRPDLGDHVGDW
jgi:hypothetical protein